MKKENLSLSTKFHEHLLKTVGKRPTGPEIKKVNKQVRKSFDKIYNGHNKDPLFIKTEYDKRLSKIWGKVVAYEATVSEVELFLKYSGINQNPNIVSLASGLCIFELFIAKEFNKKGKMCCIDISDGMSNRAKKYVKKLKLNNVNILIKDITDLPIDSDSQNIVLARRTGLSNDEKWIKILKESYRVLKKEDSSRFIYTVDHDFNKPLNIIKEDLFKAKLSFIAEDYFVKNDGKRVDMIITKPI